MPSLLELITTIGVLAIVLVLPKLKSLHMEFKQRGKDEPD